MKQHPRITRKRLAAFSICAVVFSCIILCAIYYNNPTRQFRRATDQLFYEEMTASTLNMHYTLANPQAFGIEDYEAILPCYDGENHQESVSALQEMIDFYSGLNASKLSDRDAHTLTLLLSYLETALEASQYPYHEEPLSPSSGMQSQLPILLAEYTFRCRRDVEDYLAILSQTGDYFDSLLTFETEKKEAGLLTAASSLRSTAEQCRTILTKEALEKEEHFLQITFRERLQDLCDMEKCSTGASSTDANSADMSGADTSDADTSSADANSADASDTDTSGADTSDTDTSDADASSSPASGISSSAESPLSSREINTYIERNNQILSEIMLPAYERLADGLTALADPTIQLEGLAAKPDGAAYYQVLLKSETGSCRNIDEISQLLVEQLDEEFSQLRTLLQNIDPIYLTDAAYQECNELFPLESCGAMLTDLQKRMDGLFPDFPYATDPTGTTTKSNTSGKTDNAGKANTADEANAAHLQPIIHVKEVAPCLQDYCAPAFYLTPPLDDTINNSIYINTKTTIDPIDLYTTLAHEGFPGHLYQTVYSNQQLSAREGSPIEQLLWFGGYLEGWALYVEFMAYDYAAQIMQEAGYPEYAALLQIEKHNRSTQLCLYSLLDILIHHENTNYQGTAEVLANFGITNSASVNRIYEYIVEEPANYPKYYLGYLEILRLKEACREKWGEDYSDYDFHKFFLDNGPADFGTLNELVEEG